MPRFRRVRKKSGGRPTRPAPHTLFSRRVTALTVFFVAVCLVYAGILISLQARGNAYSIYVDGPAVPDGGQVQSVTIQAMRGNIYDRNGKPLVTNRYSYDLSLDYRSFLSVGGAHARNKLLLALLDDIQKPDAGILCADTFALVGTYPDLTYAKEVSDENSAACADLARVLKRIQLPANTTASALVAYYADTYGLADRTDGVPVYTNEQITDLLTLYYDMDARGFGASQPYIMANEISSATIAAQKEKATPAVRFSVCAERVCHYPGYASHILGRVGQIFAEDWAYYNAMGYPMNATVGTSGCEAAFESILHGTDGTMLITLDENGRTVAQQIVTQPIAGQDIRLTIDIDAQIAAEDALRAAAVCGSAVSMNANTGELLVLASAPTYDASLFHSDYEQLSSRPDLPLLNRALSSTYIPGDLMQLLTATAGLGEGVLSASTFLEDSGRLNVGNDRILCPQFLSSGVSHGTLSVTTALEERCPIFFGQVGSTLGNQAFSRWETLLGIGQETGVELGENAGKSANIYPGIPTAAAMAACGTSDCRMTPAQMCSMLATILSGGERYAAHLLYEVRDYTSGEVVYRKSAERLSDADLSGLARQLISRAMKNEALFDSSLEALTASVRASGTEVGCFDTLASSGLKGQSNALVLMFGSQAKNGTDAATSIAVVVEKQTDTDTARQISAAVLNALY